MQYNLESILAPSVSDNQYQYENQLTISLICRSDSYKFSHAFAYPENITGMSSYGTARVHPSLTIVVAGIQGLLKTNFTQRITQAHVDEAEAFSVLHFGRTLFSRSSWEKVVNVYDGFLPLIIRAMPEGSKIRGGDPIYSVTCLDPDLFWMSAYFETVIQRGIWYPTTVASMDYDIKQEIKRFYRISGADMELLPFALHDFGGRGVTCSEQAQIGGAAHLFNFMGSDTVEGILYANNIYKHSMAGFSVFATEHSIECSFGLDDAGEEAYIASVLKNALPGTIISIVIDGKDTMRCATKLCTIFRQQIIDSNAKVVFRPDSGDMMEIVPALLRLQEVAFGVDWSKTNGQKFKKIRHVGIIQGDGVDHMSIKTLLGNLVGGGWRADNVVFGSGGALLQKVNRDTLKFAQKASAVCKNGTWVGIAKDPITDPGKKSLAGIMTLVRSRMTGQTQPASLHHQLNEEFEDLHKLVYHTGKLYNETSLEDIRMRIEN